MKKWICGICGYIYDEAKEGVALEALPENWVCPLCGADKSAFSPQQSPSEGKSQPAPIHHKVLDKAIEQQFEIIPNTLTSIPGIGKVYSAGIIAEIGDIHRFDSQASVAKFAGLVWTQHQSGEFEAEHSRMIKSGNRYLRYYLLEAANSVRRCDSEFRRYYDLKFKEVNKYQHKRALALTARKLVRLVFRLLKDNRLYIPSEG